MSAMPIDCHTLAHYCNLLSGKFISAFMSELVLSAVCLRIIFKGFPQMALHFMFDFSIDIHLLARLVPEPN